MKAITFAVAPPTLEPMKLRKPVGRLFRQLARRLVTFGLSLGLAGAAHANGALPATIQVLLPPAAPKTVIVSTNFGLITSTDGGATWSWICEHDVGLQGNAYQVTAAPATRVLALSNDGLVATDDSACTWNKLMGLDVVIPFDYFPDPTDANHLLALGILRSQQRGFAVMELKSTAVPMPPLTMLYAAPAGQELNTLEIARSNPKIIYATLSTAGNTQPAGVARTEDGGVTWTVTTPDPTITELGILAVDSDDPNKLFFRVAADDGDRLFVSTDGGKTVRNALSPKLTMSGFSRLSNGHVLIAFLDIDHGYIYRSIDGGMTFPLLPSTIHPRSMAERAGRVYATTDVNLDKYALGYSDDEGATWKRAMGLEDVVASKTCNAACAYSCNSLLSRKVFAPGACGPMDGGAVDGGDGGVDAPEPVADAAAPEPDAPAPIAKPKSSGCAYGTEVTPTGLGSLLVVGLALLRARRRR